MSKTTYRIVITHPGVNNAISSVSFKKEEVAKRYVEVSNGIRGMKYEMHPAEYTDVTNSVDISYRGFIINANGVNDVVRVVDYTGNSYKNHGSRNSVIDAFDYIDLLLLNKGRNQ